MNRERGHLLWSRFWRVFFWEFIQNLPLLAGFMMALRLWQSGRLWLAAICIIGSSIIGACIIWATEFRIVAAHHEPLRAVLANIVVMSILMVVLVVYLTAAWSRWWTDLIVGSLTGVALGGGQDLATRSPISIKHYGAFALAFAVGLVGIRILAEACPFLIGILILTVLVTAVISWIDYRAVWRIEAE